MIDRELRNAVATTPAGARWSGWFVLAGLGVIAIYLVAGVQLSQVVASYFVIPKVERDAATTGSAVLAQLQYLQAASAWLEPFKFVGLSLIITGIVLSLSAIIQTLRTRAAIMQQAFVAMKGAAR